METWREHMGWQAPLYPPGNLVAINRLKLHPPEPLRKAWVILLTHPDPSISLETHYRHELDKLGVKQS